MKSLLPRPLAAGDTVAVVAACGPPIPETLDAGIKFVTALGFRVRTGKYLAARDNYLAGTDEQRSSDLNDMLRDPEVRGVFLARGGYGAMRILDMTDLDAVLRRPKWIVGMSDVTALQLSLFARCGLITLSGPMVAGQIGEGLDTTSEHWLRMALTRSFESRDLFPEDQPVRALRRGIARGPLLGGCLSLITALTGTGHSPDYSGAVLFLEDIGEAPYRIDRMLTQLKLAGILDGLSGLILGHFIGPDGNDLAPEAERLVLEMTRSHPIPVISGFPHGHKLPNLTLPHGARVELDTEARSMIVQP
jgi:muramoyltetrapeptide carboxypeptidase